MDLNLNQQQQFFFNNQFVQQHQLNHQDRPTKRSRRHYSKEQITYLQNQFDINPYPSGLEQESIAFHLAIPTQSVLWWFQNKRRHQRMRGQTFNRISRRRSNPYDESCSGRRQRQLAAYQPTVHAAQCMSSQYSDISDSVDSVNTTGSSVNQTQLTVDNSIISPTCSVGYSDASLPNSSVNDILPNGSVGYGHYQSGYHQWPHYGYDQLQNTGHDYQYSQYEPTAYGDHHGGQDYHSYSGDQWSAQQYSPSYYPQQYDEYSSGIPPFKCPSYQYHQYDANGHLYDHTYYNESN